MDNINELTGLSNGQMIGFVIVIISSYFYVYHKNNVNSKENKFKLQAGYKNISPFKHDVYKTIVAELIPILLLSRNADDLINFDSFFDSFAGRLLIIFVYYLVFYHVVEPYIANRTNLF